MRAGANVKSNPLGFALEASFANIVSEIRFDKIAVGGIFSTLGTGSEITHGSLPESLSGRVGWVRRRSVFDPCKVCAKVEQLFCAGQNAGSREP
jgi:hypothetical protein